ncbi:hypothetical protein DF039_27165 [Burkholderia cenocepacia]|nr:hypothetical protein DF039_27165 [Burkholderia cenocepacia]
MAQGTHRRIVSFHGGPALTGKADWHVEHLKANRPRGWPRPVAHAGRPRWSPTLVARRSGPLPLGRAVCIV